MSRHHRPKGMSHRAAGIREPKFLHVTGLNDKTRVDRTDRPFFSLDGLGPREIDDALRVTRSAKGNFMLEVAIVDGAQLDPDDKQTERAIKLRQSQYAIDRRRDKLMLSDYVIRAMELRGGRRRATVITQQFDTDALPKGEAEIVPAWISVSNRLTGTFLNSLGTNYRQLAASHEMADFAQRWLSQGDNPAPLNRTADQRMVDASMKFANEVVTGFAEQEGLAIPLRLLNGSEKQSRMSHFIGPTALLETEDPPRVKATFTAPLRVAAHLITHQQVGAHLAGIEVPYTPNDISLMAPDLFVTNR